MVDLPYFMTDESWYYFDYKDRRFKLTDKAPRKAIESLEQFYRDIKEC